MAGPWEAVFQVMGGSFVVFLWLSVVIFLGLVWAEVVPAEPELGQMIELDEPSIVVHHLMVLSL